MGFSPARSSWVLSISMQCKFLRLDDVALIPCAVFDADSELQGLNAEDRAEAKRGHGITQRSVDGALFV